MKQLGYDDSLRIEYLLLGRLTFELWRDDRALELAERDLWDRLPERSGAGASNDCGDTWLSAAGEDVP